MYTLDDAIRTYPTPFSLYTQSVAATPTGSTTKSEGGNADKGSVAKKRNEPTRSLDDIVSEAFGSSELAAAAASGGLSATDVQKWIEKRWVVVWYVVSGGGGGRGERGGKRGAFLYEASDASIFLV